MPLRETPEPVLVLLGARIRLIRKQRQIALSRLQNLGRNKGTHCGIERGVRSITVITAGKIAAALGVDLLHLLAFDDGSDLAQLVRQAGELPKHKLRALVEQWPSIVARLADPPTEKAADSAVNKRPELFCA